MTESEMSYSLVQVIATMEWTQLCIIVSTTCNKVRQQLYCITPVNSQLTRGLQTTAIFKLFDFMSAGERSIKTENHSCFQGFSVFPGQHCG